MRKLIEYTHVSLDGKFDGDAFWAGQMNIAPSDGQIDYSVRLLDGAAGMVLGRATYEGFAASWPSRSGELADRFNSLPKYVASRTLTETTWNAEVLPGDAIEAVAGLKESGEGSLVKYGNGPLSRALIEAGLLDEVHVSLSPFVAGAGESLLAGIATTAVDLQNVTDLGNGAVVLTYTLS